MIIKAYSLGAAFNPKRTGLKDIIITVFDMREKQRIMAEVREGKHFLLQDHAMEIFPDHFLWSHNKAEGYEADYTATAECKAKELEGWPR